VEDLLEAKALVDVAEQKLEAKDEEIETIEDIHISRAKDVNIANSKDGLKSAALAIAAAVLAGAAAPLTGPPMIGLVMIAAIFGAGSAGYGARAAVRSLRWSRDEEPAIHSHLDDLRSDRKELATEVRDARKCLVAIAAGLLPPGSPDSPNGD
jgi:hypothetical protein